MPGLIVTIGGSSAGFSKELATVERASLAFKARMSRNIASGLGQWMATGTAPNPLKVGFDDAAKSGFSLNGVMQESLVLLREIGRGNWTRVPGSFSRLLEYAGALKYVLSPLGIMIAGLAVGAYVVAKNFRDWHTATKNLHDIFSAFRLKLSEESDIIKKTSEETQKFNDWLHSLGDEHVTLAEKVDRAIKRLREELRLQMELAKERGASPQQLQRMELAAAQHELDVVERAKEAAYAKLAADRESAKLAATQATDKGLATNLTNASSALADLKQVANAVQAKLKAGEYADLLERRKREGGGVNYSARFDTFTGKMVSVSLNEMIQHLENDFLDVTVGNKKYTLSLNAARKKLEEATAAEAELKNTQTELNKVLEKKQKLTEKDVEDIRRLAGKESDLLSQIALAGQYGEQIATGAGRHGGGSAANVTERERIGAGAVSSIQLNAFEVQKQIRDGVLKSNAHLEKMVRELSEGGWL